MKFGPSEWTAALKPLRRYIPSHSHLFHRKAEDEMSNNQRRRVVLTLGATAGGLLAAAFLPTAVAFADEYGPEDGSDPGISDLLITPCGDFQLLGSFFSDLATALG
jgi:hypothetical protein